MCLRWRRGRGRGDKRCPPASERRQRCPVEVRPQHTADMVVSWLLFCVTSVKLLTGIVSTFPRSVATVVCLVSRELWCCVMCSSLGLVWSVRRRG